MIDSKSLNHGIRVREAVVVVIV